MRRVGTGVERSIRVLYVLYVLYAYFAFSGKRIDVLYGRIRIRRTAVAGANYGQLLPSLQPTAHTV